MTTIVTSPDAGAVLAPKVRAVGRPVGFGHPRLPRAPMSPSGRTSRVSGIYECRINLHEKIIFCASS